jgi:hypothetical protein
MHPVKTYLWAFSFSLTMMTRCVTFSPAMPARPMLTTMGLQQQQQQQQQQQRTALSTLLLGYPEHVSTT